MSGSKRIGSELSATIDCSVEAMERLEAIERFCLEFHSWSANQCLPEDVFYSELLLREALVNAVEHSAAVDYTVTAPGSSVPQDQAGPGHAAPCVVPSAVPSVVSSTLPNTVHCVLRCSPRRILIAVRDPGPGFDWRAARCLPEENNGVRGRGLAILHQYAHQVRYLERGNGVTLIRRFPASPGEKAN